MIDEIDDRKLLENATDVGTYLQAGLEKLAGKYSFIGNIQGAGLFWGLDLVSDPVSKTPMSDRELRHITTLLKDEGVLMGYTGRYNNCLKIRPPLIFSKENADQALSAMDRVFRTLG